ncbi:MAG: SGNH/GDSL hydrolase family protein [Eubacteriales bacterium]|nr:SGNH/GDSL hydrolase family protein [Eubacteriales bacterium]
MKTGVNAPKDPIAKKAGFYIMKSQEIGAIVESDGSKVRDIYLDDGRLENAAWIQGGIDETLRARLSNPKGFREVVRAIGFTIEASKDDEAIDVDFMFYAKTDKYVSGSHIASKIVTNGVEQIIDLADFNWSDDDLVVGKLAFLFPASIDKAVASVKLYVNDGIEVPPQEEDNPVDTESLVYKNMIKKSLMQVGTTARFKEAVRKAKNGEDVTIAFIGGSITQGAGSVPCKTNSYAFKAYNQFKTKFASGDGSHVHFVKAGIGGTPSELGIIRYDRDVEDFGKVKPDVVIVEFAVNDADDETGGDCYEGLVRRIWNSENHPAVILLFSVFANDWNLQERFIPIGEVCKLPMISIMDAVTPQFSLTKDTGKVLSKGQFFYDIFHPSNIGHQIMADCIGYYYDEAVNAEDSDMEELPVVRSKDFENIKYIDRTHIPSGIEIEHNGFCETDTALQSVEEVFTDIMLPMFKDNWMWNGTSDNKNGFKMIINCRVLLIAPKDSDDKRFGCVDIYIDGEKVCTYDPSVVGWTHCGSKIILREQECKKHIVEIKMAEGQEDKFFTILGFGYMED